MIDLELYRIFQLVAETNNITKASEILYISQPAVTKQIKNLEDQLGCKLFIRTNKGVKLNDNGRKIYNNIKQAMSLIKTAEREINDLKELYTGTVKIGISTSLTKLFLFPFIETFHKQYPNVIFEINTDPTKEQLHLLKDGSLDLIIAKIPNNISDEYSCTIMGQLHDVFIVNKDYNELINQPITLEKLNAYPILIQTYPSNSRLVFNKLCTNNNIEIESIMEIASSNLIVDFTKIGYGIGFVTREYIISELNNKELFELNVIAKVEPVNFGIIKLKDNSLSLGAQEFIKTITKKIESD